MRQRTKSGCTEIARQLCGTTQDENYNIKNGTTVLQAKLAVLERDAVTLEQTLLNATLPKVNRERERETGQTWTDSDRERPQPKSQSKLRSVRLAFTPPQLLTLTSSPSAVYPHRLTPPIPSSFDDSPSSMSSSTSEEGICMAQHITTYDESWGDLA